MELDSRDEISVQDILFMLLSRLRLIVLITLLCTVAAFSYAKFLLPLQYTSSIKIYVKNQTSTSTTGVAYSDITAAKSLVETYVVILDDESVYNYVSDRLIEDYAIEDLQNYFTILTDDDGKQYIPSKEISKLVSFSSVNDTEVLKVSCTCRVPKFAADICTYISDYAPDHITRITQAGSVETVSDAIVPTTPSGPNVWKYTIVGFAVGLVVSVALAILLSSFDNEVTGAEEIKQRFNVPVLGEIPDIFMDEKGAGKYAKYSK
jgi:capsular polysaccharide biosynthesis protein